MILDKIGYSYNDLTVIPAEVSDISSRSECNPTYENNMLPIFASCMSTVVSSTNYNIFEENGITPVIPRNVDITVRIAFMELGKWVALSLSEFSMLFVDNYKERKQNVKYQICVDIANGHMKDLFSSSLAAKENAIKYELSLMVGNIANPLTYKKFAQLTYYNQKNKKWLASIDYVRVGIGGGLGCFIDGTQILTKDGTKNIEDINDNDYVLTIDGSYQKVIGTLRYQDNKLIKINNEIVSTVNHKYFVINKTDKNKVNETNLQKYGYWVEANKLDPNIHLLIKKYK